MRCQCHHFLLVQHLPGFWFHAGFTQVSTLTSSLDWVHLTRCPPCHCFHRQGSFPQSGFPPIVKAEETYVRRNFFYVSLHDHLLEYFRNKTCGWRLYRNLFAALYSPGKGPVLVTSYAEAFPLYIREVGMSLPLRPFGPVNHLAFKP